MAACSELDYFESLFGVGVFSSFGVSAPALDLVSVDVSPDEMGDPEPFFLA